MSRIRDKMEEDEAAMAAEYGVLLAFVILLIIVGVSAYGTTLNTFILRLVADIRVALGV